MSVTSRPSRTTFATPSGIGSSESWPEAFSRRYRYLFSRYSVGLLSRIELTSRPAASSGVPGMTILSPGTCAK